MQSVVLKNKRYDSQDEAKTFELSCDFGAWFFRCKKRCSENIHLRTFEICKVVEQDLDVGNSAGCLEKSRI